MDGNTELTPVVAHGPWWAKLEYMAGYTGPEAPSGAKVRQYAAMIEAGDAGATLMVGCSADGAMQIYVAHAAGTRGMPSIVVVPKRRQRTAATEYAEGMGAEVVEVSPGYPSVYRARVRAIVAERGLTVVRWDRALAFHDTAAQVANLPRDTRRVVVPTGTGLTAAGVLYGLHAFKRRDVEVVAVCVSPLAIYGAIPDTVTKYGGRTRVPLAVIPPTTKYADGVAGALPDGTPLDSWYAAKALAYVQPGDVLWVTGRRPDRLLVNG